MKIKSGFFDGAGFMAGFICFILAMKDNFNPVFLVIGALGMYLNGRNGVDRK